MKTGYVHSIYDDQESICSENKINIDDFSNVLVDLENYFVIENSNTVYYTTDIKTCIALLVETDNEKIMCHLAADEQGFTETGKRVLANLIAKYYLNINKVSIFYGYKTSDETIKFLYSILETKLKKDIIKEENIVYLDTIFGIREDVEGSLAFYNNCIYGYDKDERTITPFIKEKNNLSNSCIKYF